MRLPATSAQTLRRALSSAAAAAAPSLRAASSSAPLPSPSSSAALLLHRMNGRSCYGRRCFAYAAVQRAVSTTPASSINDPAEEAAQKHMEEGTALIESGDLEKAKEAYERSIAIKESSSALFNLGVCQYHAKDLTAAIASWTRVIELAPSSSDAHMNIASAFVMSVPPRPDLAIDHLKTAASISPDDAEIQFNLGAVLEACEQLEEAAKAYQRALDGGIARAEMNLRNISAKRAAALLAVKEFEKSQEQAAPAKEQDAEKKDPQ